jgi:hypothetical protein
MPAEAPVTRAVLPRSSIRRPIAVTSTRVFTPVERRAPVIDLTFSATG